MTWFISPGSTSESIANTQGDGELSVPKGGNRGSSSEEIKAMTSQNLLRLKKNSKGLPNEI